MKKKMDGWYSIGKIGIKWILSKLCTCVCRSRKSSSIEDLVDDKFLYTSSRNRITRNGILVYNVCRLTLYAYALYPLGRNKFEFDLLVAMCYLCTLIYTSEKQMGVC